MSKFLSVLFVLSLTVLSGCPQENATRNLNGTCKEGFIDAYNETVQAWNTVVMLAGSPSTSGASLTDALEKAQAKCANLLGNFSNNGTCEANRTAKAEDLRENCTKVDEILVKIRTAEASEAPAFEATEIAPL